MSPSPRVPRCLAYVARFATRALAAVVTVAPGLQAQLAIRDVTVIDGTGAAPRPHQTVLVLRDRIAAVGDAGSVAIPPRTRIIDGRGKFLLPGFIDVHAHTSIGPMALDTSARPPRMTAREDVAASREALRVLLAFGITTIRDPGGPTASTVALRDSLRLGLVTGPHMVTAGSIIDLSEAPGMVATVRTESELRAEVARQAAAGVDYVKLYASLPAPLVRAGIDEAHKRGVRAIAHLFGTSWTEAATAGIDGIVHITPGSPALLTDEARPRFMQRFRGTQFMLEWFSFADLQSPQIREMTAALVAHQVFLDPTLVIFESLAWGDSARILDGRDLAYAAPSIVTAWKRFSLTEGWKAEDFAAARAAWPQVMAFTRHLYEAGVPLSAGTDIGNPFTVPGASFHRELQLLADAGIPPLEVLRIATRGGARSLGLESEVGRVVPGALADLVLLDADPVADIRHTRRISLVVQRGTASTPAQLLPARLRARGLAP